MAFNLNGTTSYFLPVSVKLSRTKFTVHFLRWNTFLVCFSTNIDAGRTVGASRIAYDNLCNSIQPRPTAPLGPRTPAPIPAPNRSGKRPYPFDPAYPSGATGREIRPKPSSSGTVYQPPSPAEGVVKKKRGRPRKAETLAKAEPSTTPSSDPGPLRSVFPAATSAPPPAAVSTPTDYTRPPSQSTSRMPIAAMLTPTQGPQDTASPSSTSSGKRRRARSTRSEPGDPLPALAPAPESQEYVSPDVSMSGLTDDSPARPIVPRPLEEAPTSNPNPLRESDNLPPKTESSETQLQPQRQ